MKIYIFIILFIVLWIFLTLIKNYNLETFSNYSSSCRLSDSLLEVMEKREDNNINKYDVYIPCSYNNCEEEAISFESKNGKKIFLIDGCDLLASKLALWDLLKNEYKHEASKYMPNTFLLENAEDLKNFPTHYKNNKYKRNDQLYVLKNYEQRQEGIKLTRDLDYIMNGLDNGWYLVQDYIYNPYLINGHKINLRYYLLIICTEGKINSYVHKDGFVYYTPEKYNEYDITFNKHITTGYVDRKMYDENPLTLDNFRDHLDSIQPHSSQLWNDNLLELMKKLMKALNKKICKNPKLNNHVRFQLFGCDLAPSNNLDATLIEINKGPDLDSKDERDKKVKMQVLNDIFKIIDSKNINETLNTRFIKII